MANSKPNSLAKFIKGVLISSIRGAVDTLNWVISFCDNFDVGVGLKFSGAKDGKPILKLLADDFSVEKSESDEGEVVERDDKIVIVLPKSGSSEDLDISVVSGSDSNVHGDVDKTESNVVITLDVYYV